jgi:hypothetical protein
MNKNLIADETLSLVCDFYGDTDRDPSGRAVGVDKLWRSLQIERLHATRTPEARGFFLVVNSIENRDALNVELVWAENEVEARKAILAVKLDPCAAKIAIPVSLFTVVKMLAEGMKHPTGLTRSCHVSLVSLVNKLFPNGDQG